MADPVNFAPKQTYEEFFLGLDFTDELGVDILASATVTAIEIESGEDATDDVIITGDQVVGEKVVYFWHHGGVSGNAYRFSVKAVSAAGMQLERDASILVRDV